MAGIWIKVGPDERTLLNFAHIVSIKPTPHASFHQVNGNYSEIKTVDGGIYFAAATPEDIADILGELTGTAVTNVFNIETKEAAKP